MKRIRRAHEADGHPERLVVLLRDHRSAENDEAQDEPEGPAKIDHVIDVSCSPTGWKCIQRFTHHTTKSCQNVSKIRRHQSAKSFFCFIGLRSARRRGSTLSGRVESLDHGSTAPTELTVCGTLTSVDDS